MTDLDEARFRRAEREFLEGFRSAAPGVRCDWRCEHYPAGCLRLTIGGVTRLGNRLIDTPKFELSPSPSKAREWGRVLALHAASGRSLRDFQSPEEVLPSFAPSIWTHYASAEWERQCRLRAADGDF